MVAQPEEKDWLRDLLRAAKPSWKPKDLSAAEEKLRRVGADDVSVLGRLLENRLLNKRLRQSDQKTFTDETISSLRARYIAQFLLPDQTLAAIEDAPDGPAAGLGPDVESPRPPGGRQPAAVEAQPPAGPEVAESSAAAPRSGEEIRPGGEGLPTLAEREAVTVTTTTLAVHEGLEEVGAQEPPPDGAGEQVPQAEAAAADDDGGAPAPAQAAESAAGKQDLGDVLRAARPSWTPSAVEDIEQKLARVGVCSTAQLGAVLKNGLNGMLKKAGYKTLSQESLAALQARFSEADLRPYLNPSGKRKHAGKARRAGAGRPTSVSRGPGAVADAGPPEGQADSALAGEEQQPTGHAAERTATSRKKESRWLQKAMQQQASQGAGVDKEPRWLQKAMQQQASHGAGVDKDLEWRWNVDFQRVLRRASEKAGFVASAVEGKVKDADWESDSREAEADYARCREQERAAQSERSDEGLLTRKRRQQHQHAAALQQRRLEAPHPGPEPARPPSPGEEAEAPHPGPEPARPRSPGEEVEAAAHGEEPAATGADGSVAPETPHEDVGESSGGADASLPEKARTWTAAERKLFLASNRLFDPGVASEKRRAPEHSSVRCRVSVVVPTVEDRQDYHQQLWEVFHEQTWPDKELVVVETYAREPSAFFSAKQMEDQSVVYLPIKVGRGADLSIGVKRNICTYLASGSHIANFDDDDLYAPCYLATMLEALLERGSSLATLASWYVFDSEAQAFGHLDPLHVLEKKGISPEKAAEWIFGFGFSYVYTRELALACPYPPLNYQEDTLFYRAARVRSCRGGALPRLLDPGGMAWVHDSFGICVHTLHRSSTSSTEDDAWAYNEVSPEEVRSLEVNDLDATLRRYCRRFRGSRRNSRFIRGPRRHRTQLLQVGSAKQKLTVEVPLAATFGDVRRELQRVLGEEPIELYLSPQQDDGEQQSLAFPLRDSEFVGMQREDLWAVMPLDRPVVVTVAGIPEYSLQVQVLLPHCRVQVDDLRLALLQQHGTTDAVSRRARSKVRLARVSPAGKFFPADLALEVGQARFFFAFALGELLGYPTREVEHNYPSEELERLRLLMYGSLSGAVPATAPPALMDGDES